MYIKLKDSIWLVSGAVLIMAAIMVAIITGYTAILYMLQG